MGALTGFRRRLASAIAPAPAPPSGDMESANRSAPARTFGPVSSSIRAYYDAAHPGDDNAAHYALADALAADADASPGVRQTLRNYARYEAQNNSLARGIVGTLANDVIGPVVNLHVAHPDNEQIEAAWQRFAEQIGLALKMLTMRQAQAVDGETFALFAPGPEIEGVSLDLVPFEADRVENPATVPDEQDADGIRLDARGRPLRYRVLKKHPGGNSAGWQTDANEYTADRIVHLFRPLRVEQHRGVPEIAPALPLFALLRRFTLATVSAAETAANISAVLESPAGVNEDSAVLTPGQALEFRRNMMVTVPKGWKIGQVRAEHPSSAYAEFKQEVLAEIARCLGMPYNIAAGNSSGYNYASGRLDHQGYYRAIEVDRKLWEAGLLGRLFALWWEQYRLTPAAPPALRRMPSPPAHVWYWAQHDHVDPTKQANAAKTRLEAGITSPQREAGALGHDLSEIQAERAAAGWPMAGLPAQPGGSNA